MMALMPAMNRRHFLQGLAASAPLYGQSSSKKPQHLLYAASPGIRNYEEYGGVGLVVFDIDDNYKCIRRIPTWDVPAGQKPENVKGIAASARTGHVFITSLNHLVAIDAISGKRIWEKTYEGGCDRLTISPDGKILYVPQLEGPLWHVVNAANGNVIAKIETKSASHNTVCSADGKHVYMAGLKSPLLSIADTKTNKVASTVGPFANVIRPFTVNGSNTLCFVNINDLLGFEIGDIRSGKKLHRVEVAGYQKGPVKRHGCPSHGIAMTADEKEIWVADGHNEFIHIFDSTTMPPKQTVSIKVRDAPGWIGFSLDGRVAYSSTGEIIDVATKKIVAALKDETGRNFHSEKMLDLIVSGGKVVKAGNQFGVGAKV
jgi:DNA-binding beta-propeller fold protein YncE